MGAGEGQPRRWWGGRVSIDRFERDHRRYLAVLHQRLAEGSYRPLPVRRVEIDKPGSMAKRPLGIPAVVDRVCQQALRQVLEPIFEPTFSEVSFGFRPERSAHMAMRRIWSQMQAGGRWIVDADIADFFGRSRMIDSWPWWRNEWPTAKC